MYEKGTVLRVTPPCELACKDEYGYCFIETHVHTGQTAYLEDGTIFLPHSCDEWVIGGPEEAQQLIADLQQILTEL